MPPRLTYWTGIWEPAREALSKEVNLLREALAPAAPVVSFSQGQPSSWLPRQGVFRLHGDRYVALRALAAVLERSSDFSHLVGDVRSWHLLRALRRRPVLLTAALDGEPLPIGMYDRVARFAAESELIADSLVRGGVPASRIEIVYPGVDLARFRPEPCPADTFTALFASSPASPDDLARRGIPLMVEAARRCPDVDIVLLWRQWGRVDDCLRALQALHPPSNLRVEVGDVADMSGAYRRVHATIFTPVAGHGKSCPNSVIEGLAAGRPAVVGATCGIARLIGANGAGVVLHDRTPEALAEALRELRRNYETYARDARRLAERTFSERNFIQTYQELYRQVANGSVPETQQARVAV